MSGGGAQAPIAGAVLDVVVEGVPRRRACLAVEDGQVSWTLLTEGERPRGGSHPLADLPTRVQALLPRPSPAADAEPLPPRIELPTELYLGSARAVREGRPDLLAALVADLHPPDWPPVDTGVLQRLHAAVRGRLRVLARRPGDVDRVGSWLLHDDGWREVGPAPSTGVRLVRRTPADLGLRLRDLLSAASAGPTAPGPTTAGPTAGAER